MNEYNLRFAQYWKIVWTIVIVPLIILPFIYVMVQFPDMPDWLVFAIICVLLACIIVLVLWMVKRISPKIKLTVTGDELRVEFLDNGFLFPDDFVLQWEQITNFWDDEYDGAYFMSFQTEIKPYKFHLSAVTNNDDDVIIYAEALQNITQRINTFNRHTGKRITAKTIYESVWAKVFAVIAVVLLICAPLINLFTGSEHRFPWWQYAFVVLIAIPLVYKVYDKNRRK